MRRLGLIIAAGTLMAAGAYSVVSLYRWEWTRALYFGLVFLAAEVAIVGALIARQPGPPQAVPADEARLRARLRESRPRAHRFEWLDPMSGRTNVFVTMLVGGGVLLSGLAWLVDRVAAGTVGAAAERRLARDLHTIGYPKSGLVVDDVTVLAQAMPHCDDPQLRKLLRRAGEART